ncbi:hypothetical protein SAV14893_096770 [Streptomyces avermitilis]|nr:hypothetical protein SAV14893_096770 [Streptomyces avermitilis]
MMVGRWCSGALTDTSGATCMMGAIRAEAGGSYPAVRESGGRQWEASAVAWLAGGLWLHHTLRITKADGASDVRMLIVPGTCGRGRGYIDMTSSWRPSRSCGPQTAAPRTSTARSAAVISCNVLPWTHRIPPVVTADLDGAFGCPQVIHLESGAPGELFAEMPAHDAQACVDARADPPRRPPQLATSDEPHHDRRPVPARNVPLPAKRRTGPPARTPPEPTSAARCGAEAVPGRRSPGEEAQTSPLSRAYSAAWVRSRRPSRLSTREMWFLTVPSLR